MSEDLAVPPAEGAGCHAGADTMRGGLGNDTIIGGRGNDTYQFARGDGQDTIVERDAMWFNSDSLVIAQATRDQIWLTRTGNDLEISIVGTQDKVLIDGWFSSYANRVEKISVDGGKSWGNLADLTVPVAGVFRVEAFDDIEHLFTHHKELAISNRS